MLFLPEMDPDFHLHPIYPHIYTKSTTRSSLTSYTIHEDLIPVLLRLPTYMRDLLPVCQHGLELTGHIDHNPPDLLLPAREHAEDECWSFGREG